MMGYKIKFDDITSLQISTQTTIGSWGESVSSLNTAMSGFINDPNLQGQAVTSIRTYLSEVHGTFLQTLINLMNDYSASLLLYKDGYYNIDSNNHAELPENTFTTLQSDLKTSRDHLKSQIELLNTARSKISDLVSYSGSSHTKTIQHYNFIINDIKTLDESIKQYESNHASHDLSAFKELLASTKALLTEYSNRPRVVATYQSGDIGRLTNIERFATAYEAVANHLSNNAERLQAAQERDQARFEALAAEERTKQGWIDLALGAVTIAVGLAAIVATAGAATPLVVGAGVVAGTGTIAYGASNVAEAGQDIYLGYKGDGKTLAINPIRDTLFMGNDKLYHQVGGLFTTTSAVMIPIGQTQSVTKGLAEFAIGEVGGFVGGQAGYYGTKLLGGSEADAERATFVGSILGGFAASSAASKFSLNDIGETRATSFMDEMSPEDARRYEQWNKYVEAGISPENRVRVLEISEKAPKVEYQPDYSSDSILSIPKGDRPDVNNVFSPEYIEAHKQQFDNGAIKFQKFTPEEGGFNNGAIGNPKDHVAFVMPKDVGETLIEVSKGDPRILEDLLGLHPGDLGDSPVAIDIPAENLHNVRIPSGNEDSAFDGYWKPGGRTYPGDMPEAVVDEIPWSDYTFRQLGGH
ncbi:TPA: T7SS effector LXG polymorphic toxin [Streptococcus suis]